MNRKGQSCVNVREREGEREIKRMLNIAQNWMEGIQMLIK